MNLSTLLVAWLHALEQIFSYSYCVFGHYPSSYFFISNTTFQRLDSVSVFSKTLLSWTQSIDLIPISGHQYQHKIGYSILHLHTKYLCDYYTYIQNLSRCRWCWNQLVRTGICIDVTDLAH
jgi:hypothetical protein